MKKRITIIGYSNACTQLATSCKKLSDSIEKTSIEITTFSENYKLINLKPKGSKYHK